MKIATKTNEKNNGRMILAFVLKKLREGDKSKSTKKKTQNDLASLIGTSRGTIANMESGLQTITTDIRSAITKELGVKSEIFDILVNYLEGNEQSREAIKQNPLFNKIFPDDLLQEIESVDPINENRRYIISEAIVKNIIGLQVSELSNTLRRSFPDKQELKIDIQYTLNGVTIRIGNQKVTVTGNNINLNLATVDTTSP